MKNNIFKHIFLALTVAFGAVSCEDRDIVTIDTASAPIVMDLSAESLVLDENFPNNPALTVTWKDAAYTVPVEVKYTVEISATEGFEDAKELIRLPQSTTVIAFSHKEMNEAAKNIGLTPYQPQQMYFRVLSYLGDGDLSQVSNVTSLMITPYAASPTYKYNDLYLIGSATAADWDNAAGNINMYPLLKNAENSSEYSFTGYFKGGPDAGFKMVRVKGDWSAQFGYGGSEGALDTDGGSGNIPVPADGYYKLTVNTADLAYTLTPVAAPSVTYGTVGIIGTATELANWDADVALVQSAFDPNVWVGKGFTLKEGEFKFRADANWDFSWGTNAEFFGTAVAGGANIPVSAEWKYDIYFNDATGAYSFIPVND